MSVVTLLEVFGVAVTALGGYEGVKWLVSFFVHRKQEKQLKENEVERSEVATENAMRDMYEETLAKMRQLDEQRITEIRADYQARISELNKANAELHETNRGLHKENMELLKESADKTVKIRELQELRVEDARKIGKLEKKLQHFDCWKCFREFGEGEDKCLRRMPKQNPPVKYIPIEDD